MRSRRLSLFLCVGWAWLLGACSAEERPAPPVAQDGVIDLRGWDFDKHGAVPLSGEWLFWWEAFVPPEAFVVGVTPPEPHGLYPVPRLWTGMEHPTQPGTMLTGDGYGTLAVKVLLPPDQIDRLGVYDKAGYMSYDRYWVAEGEPFLSFSAGKPGTTLESTNNGIYALTEVTPFLGQSPTLWFIYHAANFGHPRGGMARSAQIGVYDVLSSEILSSRLREATLLGILLIMGLYHFALFTQRPKDKSTLVFGVICMSLCLRRFAIMKWLDAVHPGVSSEAWVWVALTRMEYLGFIFTGALLCLLIYVLVEARWYLHVVKAFAVFSLGYTLIVVFTQPAMFAQYLATYQNVTVILSFVTIAHLLLAVLQGNSFARLLLAVFIFFFLAILNDYTLAQSTGFYAADYGFVFFILVQAYVLSLRFAQAHQTAERLTVHLQEEVDVQTQALRESSERELEKSHNLLVQSEKLAAMGQMVASIGHELANPVNLTTMSVQNQAETVKELEQDVMGLFEDDQSEEAQVFKGHLSAHFTRIRASQSSAELAATKLKELTMALRTQSRREDAAAEGVQINEIVGECLTLTGGRIKLFDVKDALGHDLPTLTCFRSRIGQVVTNLLANAGDALAEHADRARDRGDRFEGSLRVETAEQGRDGRPGLLVTVADNGPGVPEAIRAQIFEEFFTTKPAGVGTGLGLSMCLTIVKDHGGILEVSTDEALGGARFDLWLPLTPPESQPREQASIEHHVT